MAQKLSPQTIGHIGRRVLFTLKNPPPPDRLVSTGEGDIEKGEREQKCERKSKDEELQKKESKECEKV